MCKCMLYCDGSDEHDRKSTHGMSMVGKETHLGGEGHGSIDTVLVGQGVVVDGLKFVGDGEEGERGELVLAALFVALRGR